MPQSHLDNTTERLKDLIRQLKQGDVMKIITILLPLILIGCGSSRIMLNADIPQDTEISIEITTDNTNE